MEKMFYMKRSYQIAIAMTLTIVVWMLLGNLSRDTPEEKPTATTAPEVKETVTVETDELRAQNIRLSLTVQGDAEPDRSVTIRAETAGRVAAVAAKEGEFVRAGEVLVELEMSDRTARLEKYRARLEEHKQAYERAQKLRADNFQAQSLVEESYAELKATEADLARIQLDIARTKIRAPFDGILQTRTVEVGDYVVVNGDIATFVDNQPLVVAVPIAQQDIAKISRQTQAAVTFATGVEREGRVRYISPRADESTRTFRVEIEVANADYDIPSGVSAEVEVPVGDVEGHFLSPSLLSLNDQGEMGIKTVTSSGVVNFHKVEIVRAGTEGIWVRGLPETVRVITVGQGYVREGVTVNAVPVEKAESQSIHISELSRNQ